MPTGTPIVKCCVCKNPTEVRAPMGDNATAIVVCRSCVEADFTNRGGYLYQAAGVPEGARFHAVLARVTGGAKEALEDSGEDAGAFFERHVKGDWGSVDTGDDGEPEDLEDDETTSGTNEHALRAGVGIVHSEFATSKGVKLWVMTYAEGLGGRSMPTVVPTTIMLPEEY